MIVLGIIIYILLGLAYTVIINYCIAHFTWAQNLVQALFFPICLLILIAGLLLSATFGRGNTRYRY